MEDSQIYLSILLWVVGALIAGVVLYFFLRFVFSMKRQLWNQKQTMILLIKMAEKSGSITNSEANELITASNLGDQYLK